MNKRKNQKEASRKKSLGQIGELFALKALVDNNFKNISNTNDKKMNTACVDLYCEKGGQRYVVSVKARNKLQKNGRLNSRYNLGKYAYKHAKNAEKKHNASAHWMVLQFDKKTYSVYFGSFEELQGNKGVLLKNCADKKLGKPLVENKRHFIDFDFYTNS